MEKEVRIRDHIIVVIVFIIIMITIIILLFPLFLLLLLLLLIFHLLLLLLFLLFHRKLHLDLNPPSPHHRDAHQNQFSDHPHHHHDPYAGGEEQQRDTSRACQQGPRWPQAAAPGRGGRVAGGPGALPRRVPRHQVTYRAATARSAPEKHLALIKQGPFLADGSTPLLPPSREASFVHAISSAGVAHAVTRSCSSGELENCGCDRSLRGMSPEGFQVGPSSAGGFNWPGRNHLMFNDRDSQLITN